jgi:hypothetical protein
MANRLTVNTVAEAPAKRASKDAVTVRASFEARRHAPSTSEAVIFCTFASAVATTFGAADGLVGAQ